jgi:tetratricopeptide (TPR) repeat protein
MILGMGLLLALLPRATAAEVEWSRLEADGVVVLSDGNRKDATEFLLGYLAYRKAFAELLLPEGRELGPVCILLFRRRAALEECVGGPDERLLALTAEVDGEVYVAMPVEGDRKEALTVTYEMDTIFGLRRLGLFLPLWVEHGTGTFFSTLRVTKAGCVVGGPSQRHSALLREERWLPWSFVGGMHLEAGEYRVPAVFRMFVAQSWAGVRAVLLSRPEAPTRPFAALVGAVRRGEGPDDVLARVLGLERGVVPAYLKKLAWQATTLTVPFDAATARARIKATTATEAEVCVRRASLIQTQQNPDRAMLLLLRARELAPRDPMVIEAWARQARVQDDTNRAAQLYREAVEAGSKNPKALLFSARQRLDDTSSLGRETAGGGGVPAEQALAEIRRAVTINPGDGEAYELLGRALYAVTNPTEAELRELEPGLASPQHGTSVGYYRAMVQQRLGQHEEAAASIREVIGRKQVPVLTREGLLKNFLNLRAYWVSQQVEKLLKTSDYLQARALVGRLLGPEQWPTAAESHQQIQDWIDLKEAAERLQRLERDGPIEERRKAEAAFIERFPEHPIAERLRERSAGSAGDKQ